MATKKQSNTPRTNGGPAARTAAVKRLIEAYPESWADFLREERTSRGLPESNGRTSRARTLYNNLVTAGVDADLAREQVLAAGFKL